MLFLIGNPESSILIHNLMDERTKLTTGMQLIALFKSLRARDKRDNEMHMSNLSTCLDTTELRFTCHGLRVQHLFQTITWPVLASINSFHFSHFTSDMESLLL